ncbi:unnamed protein product [Coregonus sp. 'balchen']|nr:unnamed protein product [Coregonus sp. 'balchen']
MDILLYLLLVVGKAVTKKGVKCGGILSASSGNISSPNYPGLYPYNIQCVWLIVVAEGSSVLLTFRHFELEYHAACSYDYVKIYNGVSEDEGNLLGTFCGDVSPPRFTSSWNVMSIIFHSDRHVAHRGFSVGYRKGYSPDTQYSNNADCSWTVHVSNRSVLENNEGCNFDFVALFDGPTVTHRHLGNYCGGEKPPKIVTTSNQLLVVFKSDFNIGGRGFKAYYYSAPTTLTSTPNNIKCHWTINLARGYRIKLFFNAMELEDRNSLSDECDYDSVAVHDGSREKDPLLGRWCGSEQPGSLISKNNNMLVVLSTDRNSAYRGFSASYPRRNITMLVNTLYIDFSDGKGRSVQEYEVQCDAQRKMATIHIVSAEEHQRMNELARRQAEGSGGGGGKEADPEPHDPSDIVFISICVLAVVLMVIAVIWLVLL